MKTVSLRRVERTLRHHGFTPMRRGNGTGHSRWHRADGKRVTVVERHGDALPLVYAHALGNELEVKGICPRREFLAAVRGERLAA